jgi:tetratricopeptide (TPR) repeat protein
MHHTHICIVARLMRIADRAMLFATLLLIVAGCDQLNGRSENRKGNNFFRDQKFVDAVAAYQVAIKTVDDPTIHYNLALAYSKVFHPGSDQDVLLDQTSNEACSAIPGVKTVEKQVCIKNDPKKDDKRFPDCDEKNGCPSSATCTKAKLCSIENAKLADLATENFAIWMKTHPQDNDTRALMTQTWIDSSQYKKALDYWEALDKAKPNDPQIMGSLAGINLKANDWRKSIEWYGKLAAVATEPSAKVAAYQFIGNVAWSKLNSKTLTREDSVELADRGIGALQHASELQPDNPKPIGLMASINNFRGLAQGPAWASLVDRTIAQDLQHTSHVLNMKAKAAAGGSTPPTTPTTPPAAPPTGANNTTPPKTGG